MGISTGEKDDGLDKSNHSDSTTTTTTSSTTITITTGKDKETTSQNQHHNHQQYNKYKYEQNENSKMMKVNSEEIGQKEGESAAIEVKADLDLDIKSRAKIPTTIPDTTSDSDTDTNTLVRVSHSATGESPANRTNLDEQSAQIDSSGLLQVADTDDQNQNLSSRKVKKNSSKIQKSSKKSSSSSSSCQSFVDESQTQQVDKKFPQEYTCCPYQAQVCHLCTNTTHDHVEDSKRENNEIQLKDSESIIIVKSQIEECITCNNCTCTTCSSSSRENDGNLEVLHPVNYTESNESVCRICHDNPSKFELMSPCLCKGSMGRVHRHCLERWLGESGKSTCEICGYQYITIRRPKYTGFSSFCAWIRHPTTPNDMRNFFFDLACFFILTPLAGISAWLCVVGAQHYSFGSSSSSGLNMNAIPHRQNRIQGQGLDQQVEGLQTGAAEPYDIYAMNPGGGRHNNNNNNNNNNRRMNRNKLDSSNSAWTSIGLLTLTGTLLAAYYIWLFVAIRYHIQVWREWQMRNFLITIVPVSDENLCQCHTHTQQDQNQNIPNNNNNNNNNTQQNRQSSSSEYSGTSSSGDSVKSTASTSNANANGGNNNDNSSTISSTTRTTTNIYEGSTSDGLKINISGTPSGLKINVRKVESTKVFNNISQMDDSSADSHEPNQKRRKIHNVHRKSSESSTCSCSCSCLDRDHQDHGRDGRKRCRNRNMKISLTSLITNRNSGTKVYPEFTILQMPTDSNITTTNNNNEGTPKNVNININGTISSSTRPTNTRPIESSRENRTSTTSGNHHEKESLEGDLDLNDNSTSTSSRNGH